MKIFIQRIYSFKKTCELFIQQIYSFKKIGNYSFNENIHSIEKMGYRPPLFGIRGLIKKNEIFWEFFPTWGGGVPGGGIFIPRLPW